MQHLMGLHVVLLSDVIDPGSPLLDVGDVGIGF